MDMGCFRIFHDARNDQVMMSIEVSFIYTFFFPVNVGCVRVCLGLIILFILFTSRIHYAISMCLTTIIFS